MSQPAAPRAELRAAFLGTTYGLPGERFRLSETRGKPPGWTCPGLNWAIVTAWNPAGRQAPAQVNHERQALLRATVARRNLPFVRGVNGVGEWQEETLIVLGARLKDAAGWGQQFGQAAVVYGCGARAALIWSGSPDTERFWAVT